VKVVHVLRKPCSEGTVAANVLRHGTGALNIDGSRLVSNGDRANERGGGQGAGRYEDGARPKDSNQTYGGTLGGRVAEPHPGGRWPANLVLQHLDGCRQEGTREVRVVESNWWMTPHTDRGMMLNGSKRTSMAHYVTKGRETVAAWSCEPGCPVAALDAQSGVLPARGNVTSLGHGGGGGGGVTGWGKGRKDEAPRPELNAPGGASRFFRQVGGSQTTTATPRPPTPGDPSPPGGRRGGG